MKIITKQKEFNLLLENIDQARKTMNQYAESPDYPEAKALYDAMEEITREKIIGHKSILVGLIYNFLIEILIARKEASEKSRIKYNGFSKNTVREIMKEIRSASDDIANYAEYLEGEGTNEKKIYAYFKKILDVVKNSEITDLNKESPVETKTISEKISDEFLKQKLQGMFKIRRFIEQMPTIPKGKEGEKKAKEHWNRGRKEIKEELQDAIEFRKTNSAESSKIKGIEGLLFQIPNKKRLESIYQDFVGRTDNYYSNTYNQDKTGVDLWKVLNYLEQTVLLYTLEFKERLDLIKEKGGIGVSLIWTDNERYIFVGVHKAEAQELPESNKKVSYQGLCFVPSWCIQGRSNFITYTQKSGGMLVVVYDYGLEKSSPLFISGIVLNKSLGFTNPGSGIQSWTNDGNIPGNINKRDLAYRQQVEMIESSPYYKGEEQLFDVSKGFSEFKKLGWPVDIVSDMIKKKYNINKIVQDFSYADAMASLSNFVSLPRKITYDEWKAQPLDDFISVFKDGLENGKINKDQIFKKIVEMKGILMIDQYDVLKNIGIDFTTKEKQELSDLAKNSITASKKALAFKEKMGKSVESSRKNIERGEELIKVLDAESGVSYHETPLDSQNVQESRFFNRTTRKKYKRF